MKELKDYLHLYGNRFNPIKVIVDGDEEKYFWDVDVSDENYINITLADTPFRDIQGDSDNWNVYNDDDKLSRIKPILRPLSSMTEEEIKIFADLKSNVEVYKKEDFKTHIGFRYKWADDDIKPETTDGKCHSEIAIIKDAAKLFIHPEKFTWLLSKHFDLFGLIEAGLAIDEIKHNTPNNN